MGSGFSRRKKPVEDQHVESQTKKTKFCSSCGCENGIKPHSDSRDTLSEEQKPQVLNLDRERAEKATNEGRKNFYFYPTKDQTDEETLYVTTSQFPYTKPKAVVVRQHVVNQGIKAEDHHYPNVTENTINNQAQKYPKLTAALEEHLGVNDGKRPYHFVNDRRWSIPNVLPSSGFAPQKALPHRSVAELRRCSLNYPSNEQYDGYYSYNCQFSGSGRRPPTPSPTAWYPARRTNDYLVASSLLAMERERDRMKAADNSQKDMNHF